MKVEKSLI